MIANFALNFLWTGLNAPETATLTRVDRPEQGPLLVAIDRLCWCPSEIDNTFWPPDKSSCKKKGTGKRSPRKPPGASTKKRVGVDLGNTDPSEALGSSNAAVKPAELDSNNGCRRPS